MKVLDGSSRRDSIQRHVNDSSDTAKGSSPGTSPEAFPFCPAWLIEMYMGINQSGEENMWRVVRVDCTFGEVLCWYYGMEDGCDFSSRGRNDDSSFGELSINHCS